MRLNAYAKISIVAAICIVLIAAYALQPTAQATNEKKVSVGAVLALSGEYAVFGNSMREGLELAVDELNEQGGIRYTLIIENDENADITKAVQAGTKLINVDNVPVSFVTAADEGKALSRTFESGKTPMVVLFDSNNELAEGEYTFGIGFSTEAAAKNMAEFAYNDLDIRTISISYSINDWSSLIASSFRNEFEKLGGKAIFFDGTAPEETDFRTFIAKSWDADAIYAPLLQPSYLMKQSRETGYKGRIISADSLNQNQIEAAGGGAEGAYFTNVYVPENEKFAKLQESYREKYGREPQIIELTAIAYDAMHAVDAAVRAEGAGSEEIKNGLYKIRIEGATGTVDFDETGMSPRFERIFVVKDGEAALVK